MSRYTLHARSGLLIAGLLLLPAAPVVAEGEAAVPTVKIEPQLRARSHASEATMKTNQWYLVRCLYQGAEASGVAEVLMRERRRDVE